MSEQSDFLTARVQTDFDVAIDRLTRSDPQAAIAILSYVAAMNREWAAKSQETANIINSILRKD